MRIALILETLRNRWRSTAAWTVAATTLISIQLFIYPSVLASGDAMSEFLKAFPEELIAMFRIEDYTSPIGFLSTELFSMMIPIVFIALGSSWGSASAAEEEQTGTSEVIYALPLSRTKILFSKMIAAWLALLLVGVVVITVISIGAPLVDLSLEKVMLVPVTVSCAALGFMFHGLALAVSAMSGKKGLGLGVGIAVALLSFFTFALAPVTETFDSVLPYNPFQWAIGQNPIKDGFDLQGLGWLALGTVVTYAIALISINRRDIRA